MNETIKQFSINDVNLFKDDDSADFALAEIYFLSDGNNAQNCPIPTEVLKRDAKTVLGKFVVAKFDKWVGDVTSHDTEEVIIGYVPMESEVRFVEKDGKTFAVCDAIISKIYATEVYSLFKEDNYRSVSSEFSCSQPNANEMGEGEVDALIVRGITLLGKSVRPAISGANMQMKKFSEKEADEYYSSLSNPLKKFADERKSKLDKKEKYVSHSIDVSKESVDMGDWNGDKAKNDLLKEKNYETLGKKVCLDFKGGERKLENCKYPVMNLKNGKWVYNAEGLSSTRAYGEQHDPSVADKAITLQKKLGLYKDDKDKEDTKKMSDVKEKEDVVMAKENETKVDDKEKKEMSAEEEKEMGCDKVMSDEDAKKDDEIEKDKEDIEKAKDDEKADEDDKKEEKSMSEQAKEFAESETDKEYIGKMFSQGLQGVVSEILELKKFQETRLELDKTNKLNSIMASVKGDLDEKQFTELQAEGVAKTFAELDSFENKVKAFAYEASKGKEKQDDGIMKFAGQGNVQTKAELTADDIFNKYL